MAMHKMINVWRAGDVVTVEIDRPEKKNALNLAAWRGLAEAFGPLAADATIRCVILRGAGLEAFASGADIGEFAAVRSNPADAKAYDETLRQGLSAVAECPHPTIAQIYGPCVGAGLELAAQCDLRIAGKSARFGVPVGKISVVMPLPELADLQRLVGPARMAEILLEARVFGADEALSMGLIHRIAADGQVEEAVRAAVQRITANAPLVNRQHKAFVRRLQQGQTVTAADFDRAYDCLTTRDFAEGMTAFAEKRRPSFTGE